MSAHPAPRATRSIRAETVGSSGLALGPNQRGRAGGEVEASIPVMAMPPSAPDEGPAGDPILLDADRSCHACAGGTRRSARAGEHLRQARYLNALRSGKQGGFGEAPRTAEEDR